MPQPAGNLTCTAVTCAHETILELEDAETIRGMVCAMLSQNGYTCFEAFNGAGASSLLRSVEEMQLILTDRLAPKMGGVVRAREQTSIFFAMPFTAAALTTTVRRALEQPWPGLPKWRPGSGPP